MHFLNLLAKTALVLLTMATAIYATAVPSPISDKTIIISHRSIASKRSFADTKAALDATLPNLNTTFRDLLNANDPAGALAALKDLPALNSFMPPRDFGQLITIYGINGKHALQYEIGNPYTASKFARHNLGAALYAPIRVALIEDSHGVVRFVFDKPTSTFGQFGDPRIDAVAVALDNELTQLFLFAGGWPSSWPLPPLP
ncbi:hypothetical protein B0H63DRAFT_541930 [Podospora didyma]|uniref:DUF302 domain-containing protein n=1 Tax=Podospora didyma TaxID=330526 RepID=A0AAE0U1N0_9PEZI|nr:hypothetical protein B0H63DRAFT_541930 [Podospora didyma]